MSLYGSRRRNNILATALCWAAAVFGLSWLVLILGALVYEGGQGPVAGRVHANDAAPRRRRGPAQRHGRLADHERHRRRGRRAARHAGRHLYGGIRTLFEADRSSSVSSTTFCSARRRSSSACSSIRCWWRAWGISRRFPAPWRWPYWSIPVVLRTTEDMLLLVPGSLREAATALGAAALLCHSARRLSRREVRSRSPACCWRSRACPARRRRCCSPR